MSSPGARPWVPAACEARVQSIAADRGTTRSHQFAVEAARFGGGQAASKHLQKAGFFSRGIGLPIAPVEGDLNGPRIGTPEVVRFGVQEADAPAIADLLAAALCSKKPESLAAQVADARSRFSKLHFIIG